MDIEVLMPANKASADGLLSVEGGGWEHTAPQMLPITIGGYVAGIATFTPGEIDKNPVMTITVNDREEPENPGFSASLLFPAPGRPQHPACRSARRSPCRSACLRSARAC